MLSTMQEPEQTLWTGHHPLSLSSSSLLPPYLTGSPESRQDKERPGRKRHYPSNCFDCLDFSEVFEYLDFGLVCKVRVRREGRKMQLLQLHLR